MVKPQMTTDNQFDLHNLFLKDSTVQGLICSSFNFKAALTRETVGTILIIFSIARPALKADTSSARGVDSTAGPYRRVLLNFKIPVKTRARPNARLSLKR